MNYEKPITSADAAENFILALHKENLLFHFEDDPSDILDKTGKRVFADADIPNLKKRVQELFEHLSDPFDIAVALNAYPDFFRMDRKELANRLDVIWQVMIPNSDHARNVPQDLQDEAKALEIALKLCAF